jgi:ElaB/YqjD/DUF883 family membrane-anchored ribosome-binding protein
MQLQLTPEQEQKFQDLKAKAEHKAQELAHDVKEFAHKAGEKISEIHPQDIVRDTGEMIKKHPMQSLAVGAVVGGLIGALLARRGRRA